MNNSEDRVRRLDVAGAQSPTSGAAARSMREQPEGAAALPAPWSSVIDGWVRDPRIRRDALIGLTLVLVAAVFIVGAVTGALGPLVTDAVGNTVVRVVAGSVLTGGVLGYGGLRLRRRRERLAERAYEQQHPGQPARAPGGRRRRSGPGRVLRRR